MAYVVCIHSICSMHIRFWFYWGLDATSLVLYMLTEPHRVGSGTQIITLTQICASGFAGAIWAMAMFAHAFLRRSSYRCRAFLLYHRTVCRTITAAGTFGMSIRNVRVLQAYRPFYDGWGTRYDLTMVSRCR